VKINLALDRLPVFTSHPEPDPHVYGGTIVLAESLDDVETAFQQAVPPVSRLRCRSLDVCIPSVFDDSLAPPGQHIMSLFTQWVPHGYADAPHEAELAAHADRVLARVEAVAPGFTSSVLQPPGDRTHQMQEEYGLVGGNIFHGELSLGQMFHARPAAGLRGPAHPGPGPLPGRLGHPWRRRGHRHSGPQPSCARSLADQRTQRWAEPLARSPASPRPGRPATLTPGQRGPAHHRTRFYCSENRHHASAGALGRAFALLLPLIKPAAICGEKSGQIHLVYHS